MDSSTPFTPHHVGSERVQTSPSNTIPVSLFGRDSERHITGTVTRRAADNNKWLTQSPHRFLIAFGLLLAPSIYRRLTEGNSPETVALATIVLGLIVGAILGFRRTIEERRISAAESLAAGTHIATGLLFGAGPIRSGRSAPRFDLYATNQGVIAVNEAKGQRNEFAVHRLDLTATPAGRVIGGNFMVDGDNYALRGVRGQILGSSN